MTTRRNSYQSRICFSPPIPKAVNRIGMLSVSRVVLSARVNYVYLVQINNLSISIIQYINLTAAGLLNAQRKHK